jgi:mediator of RNA polymerase II transcription subunit 14
MGDFPPPARTTVKASELVHRAVDKSYEDFRALLLQLPTLREDERREPLLAQLVTARKRFAQLLAVLKWSVQSPLLQQCEQLQAQAETYRNQINETNDRLFFMHADLDRAKERRYDLSTAVDVLYGGSYLRFPAIAKQAMYPRELPPVDIEEASKEVNDIIRFRLIEAEIPEQFTNIHLDGGFVTCEAEGEFEIVLTIQGKEQDSLWRVISVNTALSDTRAFETHAKSASSSSIRIIKQSAPGPSHYNHLKNLVQRAMNKSDKPFVDAFKIMREFCSALALQVLFAQAKLLMEGRWRNRLVVKFHRDQNVLDLCYWQKACVKKEAQALTDQQRLVAQLRESAASGITSQSNPSFPESSLCLRLSCDSTKQLVTAVPSPSLPPNLPGKRELCKALQVPSNLYQLSAENLLISAMRAHVSAALFTVGRSLVIESTGPAGPRTHLSSGERVRVECDASELRVARSDIGGLEESLRVSFDIRDGRFSADCNASTKNPILQNVVRQLERVLNTHCKIEVGGRDASYPADFALVSGDGNNDKANEVIHSSVRKVLCEIVAHEIAQIGMSLKGIEVIRNLSLNWERYIMFRQQQGSQMDDLTISESALYFQLTSSKDSSCYLVIEIDKYAEIDSANSLAPDDSQTLEQYVRQPSFSLLQTAGGTQTTAAGVQFIQRLPAFKYEDLYSTLRSRNSMESSIKSGSKRSCPSADFRSSKRQNGFKDHTHSNGHSQVEEVDYSITGTHDAVPHIASVLLHVINICNERMQLQHFVNFARRRRSKIRYSGEASSRTGSGTGGQVVTLSFPEKVNADPLRILAIQGHLKHSGGFELCLQLARPPFTYVIPKKPKDHLVGERSHHINENGQLIFRYPPSVLVGDYLSENPLEIFMVELICVVKPLCELAVKMESMLRAVGRYTNEIQDDGHFYVESADPFAIVLACRTKNPRRAIASGSSPDGMVTYRVTIQFKQKMGFVVNYSHKAEHPLMHFIQSALNGHSDPAQLLEALERTCIPMGILASIVESQLLCAKFYRHEAPPKKEPGESNGVKSSFGMGKKGGKGMKLGYKTKLPGEETGYYAEKSYGGDDKSFVPAELALIPRSQTHVRLSYGDRCAVDIYFLEVCVPGGQLQGGCS